MALQPIPKAWLRQVSATLRTGTSREIQRTGDFSQRLQHDFPSLFDSRVIAAFLRFLESTKPHGCPVTMDYPAGETWEFWFTLDGKRTYGKILLRTDKRRILLLSAHLPEKQWLRCEEHNQTL
jgi:hypothetical protein